MSAVNLVKGGRVNLTKNLSTPMTELFVGLRWGKIERFLRSDKDVDLDASILCYEGKQYVTKCFFPRDSQVISGAKGIYLRHSGDDVGGGLKDDDNEVIKVSLANVPDNITQMFVTLNSYSGDKLDEVPSAGIRVYEGAVNSPTKTHCTYSASNCEDFVGKRGMIVGRIFRDGSEWSFEAVGQACKERYIDDVKKVVDTIA